MGAEEAKNKNQPESPEDAEQREKLAEFVREIVRLRNVDEAGGWRTVHLKDVNPDELAPEDALMYRSARDRTTTREGFEEYTNKLIVPETGEPREGISQSRLKFREFIANRISAFLSRKEHEEREKAKKPKKDI